MQGLANQPLWTISCGVAGVILAFAATATTRRAGTAFAAGAIGLVLARGGPMDATAIG